MLVLSVLPSVVLFDIFVNILTHNLAEPAYEADVAQLEYKLVAGEHGLIIRVKGFNHKLPVSVWGLRNLTLIFPVPKHYAEVCTWCSDCNSS